MDKLHIQLLGGFRLSSDSSPLPGFHQSRRQALLSYLLLHRHKPQSRQQVAFLFWPDSTEKQAQTNLRKLVHGIRRALPDSAQYLDITTQSILWRLDAPFTADVVLFEDRLREALASERKADIRSALEQAIKLYAGDLLPGFDDEWIMVERERLRELYATSLRDLVKLHERGRDYTLALSYARLLLNQDRLQESTYRLLMRLHLLLDDRAAALHTYHICATILSEELAVEPSPATEKLRQRILRLEGEEQLQVTQVAAAVPLVGRNREWLELRKGWKRVQRGRGSLLLIQGEAGIGKTRLAEELVDFVTRQGMVAVHTRAYAAQGATTYAPIVNLLRTEPHFHAVHKLEDVWLAELSRLLPELSTNRPDLPAPLPMTEAWQQRRFHEALARGFLAAGQPLLLHFDDLQWCDGESLAWLRFLLDYGRRARLLIVGTVRDDEIDETHGVNMLHHELQRRSRSLTIDLQPLGSEEVAQLAMQFVGRPLPDDVTAQLLAETEGNPLFVLETLRTGDNASGTSDKGKPTSEKKMSVRQERHLPPKIQAVIKWRLGQLSPSARQLAGIAAVIGRSFTYDLLNAASEQQTEEVVRSLDELWRRRLIREQDTAAYDFSHDYIRDVAYSEISPILRRQLHHYVAQALREQHAAQLDSMSSQIAAHFEQAGVDEEARVFYERAGDYAVDQYANDEAITNYSRALALLPDDALEGRFEIHLRREAVLARAAAMAAWHDELQRLEHLADLLQPEDTANVRHNFELALRLSIYESVSSPGLSTERLEQAIDLARKHGWVTQEARAQQILGSTFVAHAKHTQATYALQQAIALANDGELPAIAARANEMIAAVSMFTGAGSATIERYIRKALDYGRRKGDLMLEADCLNKLGYLLVAQGEGDYERAREYYEQGLDIARQNGLTVSEFQIVGNLGVLFTHTGNYARARNVLDDAIKKAKRSSLYFFQGRRLNYLGFMYFNIGCYEKSHELQVQALERLEEERRLGWVCKAHSDLGLLYYAQGQYELAIEQLERALSMTSKIGDDRQRGYALTRQGRALTALGQFAEAEGAFEEAFTLHHNLEQTNRSIMAVAGLAELSLAQGDLTRARDHVEKVLEHLQTRQLDLTDESLAVYMSALRILGSAGDDRAESLLRMALDQLHRRADSLDDESLVKIFWEAPPHSVVLNAVKDYPTAI